MEDNNQKSSLFDKETIFLIKLTEGLYRQTELPEAGIDLIDIEKFIKISLSNNLLYYSAEEILKRPALSEQLRDRFQGVISSGKNALQEIGRSINEVKAHISDYAIIKTYRGDFMRIGNDIDVLVREGDFDKIEKKFLARGYQIESNSREEKSVGLLRAGQKKIHLHAAVSWCKSSFLDKELPLANLRRVSYNSNEIAIPEVNADALIYLAHMNFEPLLFTYAELLYLFRLLPEVDLGFIFNQASKFHWSNTLHRTINLINSLHYFLYGVECIKKERPKLITFKRIRFPYVFSRSHLIRACIEKGLFLYPLKRISKVMNILINHDAYKYIDAPERGIT